MHVTPRACSQIMRIVSIFLNCECVVDCTMRCARQGSRRLRVLHVSEGAAAVNGEFKMAAIINFGALVGGARKLRHDTNARRRVKLRDDKAGFEVIGFLC
jgi:hypothetical protein